MQTKMKKCILQQDLLLWDIIGSRMMSKATRERKCQKMLSKRL